MVKLDAKYVKSFVRSVLEEDIGEGDITTKNIIPPTHRIVAKIVAGESGIISGLPVAREVFKTLDKKCVWRAKFSDGDFVKKGQTVAVVKGLARAILTSERTVLNFLSHMSGIATLTKKFIKKMKKSNIKILDTRKTLPGLRLFEKYAVMCGGGCNNRLRLDEMVLIKDNHIKTCRKLGLPIEQVVKSLNTKIPHDTEIEFEAQNMYEVMLALNSNVDIIMLDNMSYKRIKKAIKLIRQKNKNIQIEISGNINLKNIEKLSRLDVNRISIGSITHSAPALDFSLEIE